MNFILTHIEFAMQGDADLFEKIIERYSHSAVVRMVALKDL